MDKNQKYFNFSEISKRFKVILIDSKEGNNTKIMLLVEKQPNHVRVKPPKRKSKLDEFKNDINLKIDKLINSIDTKFEIVFKRLDKIEDILARHNLK